MAGFLISSRPVPVYPGFSIILSPYIFERCKLIFSFIAVYSVGDGHQPDIVGREKFFRQAAYLDVVTTQPRQVFYKHR